MPLDEAVGRFDGALTAEVTFGTAAGNPPHAEPPRFRDRFIRPGFVCVGDRLIQIATVLVDVFVPGDIS